MSTQALSAAGGSHPHSNMQPYIVLNFYIATSRHIPQPILIMDYLHWWTSLEVQWQRAFGEVFFMHSTIPSEEEAERLFSTEVLRFAGPGAAYANMDFQLHNLSGLRALKQLKILVVTHHDIRTLDDLKDITGLKKLIYV
ncbi:MAG: hypothetical protein PW786_04320 [Arachidicoccus sp.]|nr:hypothetical protein [Arachidicoccus sp.]